MARRLPADLLDRPAEEAALAVVGVLLDKAAAAHGRLDDPTDAAALHDFRVALRRLRTWLRACRPYLGKAVPKKLRRQLRELASATSAGRDAEVQLAWIRKHGNDLGAEHQRGLGWYTGRLDERRAGAYTGAVRDVARRFLRLEKALRARLDRAPAGAADTRFGSVAAQLLGEQLTGMSDHLAALHAASDRSELHAARICGKRLRYLLEPLARYRAAIKPLVRRLRGLQDLLGEINDLHVLAADAGAGEQPAPARAGVAALVGRTAERRQALFRTLEQTWLASGLQDFRRQADAVVLTLLPAAGPKPEIEHKFLLRQLPAGLSDAPAVEIRQGWMPGSVLRERLRAMRGPDGERYFRCVKSGNGRERLELEEETTKALFDVLWPLTEGRRVVKRRYRRTAGALVWEIDQFADRDLVLAEVELPPGRKRAALPPWLRPVVLREVTDEPEFANVNLAR